MWVRQSESKTPTFSKRDHNQGSVHEDCVRQVLRNPHRFRLKELYKTDTWSHRQGRVTGKKYRYVVQRIQTRTPYMPFQTVTSVSTGTTKLMSRSLMFLPLLVWTVSIQLHFYLAWRAIYDMSYLQSRPDVFQQEKIWSRKQLFPTIVKSGYSINVLFCFFKLAWSAENYLNKVKRCTCHYTVHDVYIFVSTARSSLIRDEKESKMAHSIPTTICSISIFKNCRMPQVSY